MMLVSQSHLQLPCPPNVENLNICPQFTLVISYTPITKRMPELDFYTSFANQWDVPVIRDASNFFILLRYPADKSVVSLYIQIGRLDVDVLCEVHI